MSLAASLGLDVTAEGVEQPEQAERLREIGCGVAQGYLFAKPLPAGEVTPLLAVDVAQRQEPGHPVAA